MENLIRFRITNPKFKSLLKKIKFMEYDKKITITNIFNTTKLVLKYDGKFNLYREKGLIFKSTSYIETFNIIEKIIKVKYIIDQESNIEFFKDLVK